MFFRDCGLSVYVKTNCGCGERYIAKFQNSMFDLAQKIKPIALTCVCACVCCVCDYIYFIAKVYAHSQVSQIRKQGISENSI